MRWPIQVQLLIPILLVVSLAIVLASAITAYFGSVRARRQQEENLRRVVTTLMEASFPLTERVLQQMQGLSGAEFVLLDERGEIQARTLPLDTGEVDHLLGIPASGDLGSFATTVPVSLGARTFLARRVPISRRKPGTEPGTLVVLYHEDHWTKAVWRAASPALLVGVAAAAVAIAVTAMLARRFVRPIVRLGQETARIAAGDFQPVAVPQRNDEIRDLALSINRMTAQLSRYEADVRHHERLRTLGELGAGLAHQLRNAATGAEMAIELHQRQCPQSASAESLQVALRQLRLMESHLQRFLSLGQGRPTPHERTDLLALVDEVLQLVGPTCAHGKIELRCERPSGRLEVWGDAASLRELLVNLILNAVEAIGRAGDGTPKWVKVEMERAAGGQALVWVKDSGPGPAPTASPHLFEPFVSEKPDGIGLGLYVARQIAEAHGGSISWHRAEGVTCFRVELPLLREGSSDGAEDHGPPAGS